nr:tata-binding protein-associated factor btaf1 [Quercus suber]
MQVSSDGLRPDLKRPKFEDVSSSAMANIVSSSEVGNFDVCMKVDHGWNLPSGLDNGQLNVTSVKVDLESFFDGVCYLCKDAANTAEMKGYAEDKVSIGKADMLKNIPENCELMNLVKLARHSWLKNCEFLQECEIRLLCVLSLDRLSSAYASISKDHYCKSLCLYFRPHNRKQEKKLKFQVQSYLIQIHFMKAPEPIK